MRSRDGRVAPVRLPPPEALIIIVMYTRHGQSQAVWPDSARMAAQSARILTVSQRLRGGNELVHGAAAAAAGG